MGAINRLPRGLLAFLDTKTQGVNPAALAELVQPMMDLEPFYRSLARYGFSEAGSVGSAAVGDYAAVTVPDDELWFLWALSSKAVETGGAVYTNLKLSPYISSPSSSTMVVGGFAPTAGGVGSEVYCTAVLPGSPFVLAPGWAFGTRLGAAVGTFDLRTIAVVSKMAI